MMKAPTKHEKLLQDKLNDFCPTLFKSQWVIDDFIADFYSPLYNIVVEVDGSSHYTKLGKANDAMKELEFTKRNILILRFSNRDVEEDVDLVVNTVLAAIVHRKTSNSNLKKWGWTFPKKQRAALRREYEVAATL